MSSTPPPVSPSPSTSAKDQSPLHFFARVVSNTEPMSSPTLSRKHSLSPSPTRSSKRLSQRKTAVTLYEDSISSTSRSSYSPEIPYRRDSTSPCAVSPRTSRKPCHVSPKLTFAQKRAKEAAQPRRQETIRRAQRIKTVENSPVNPRQLRVLRMVYDEITNYPKEHWMAFIAIVIHRSFNQVKHWFSNERQKNKTGEYVTWRTELGENIRMRPSAVNLCSEWTDELFESTVMVYHFRLVRISRWEEQNEKQQSL
ncbi:hypothetical protein Moror_468 [Moniliophthora roreri MCA 2997]|uniref:Homeobox domain-containing protein n=1 Tax=Moniliophthora roreri (strain MCA 2997) TaxID=1381753 RepID=V2XW80_MONRO|nr:hypothetical protein Moror_468 [Moniliophthora roreri MCA 2997]